MTTVTYSYLEALYKRLEAASEVVDDDSRIFEGSMTAEFKALKISQSYYSKLYAYLYELGCIEIVRRGNSNTLSVLKLLKPPTVEEFEHSYLTNIKPRATLLEQRIAHVERRLPNVDIEQALASLAVRVETLEAQVRDLTK